MGALSNQLWLQPLLRIVQEAGQLPQGQDQQRLSPHCIWSSFLPGLRGSVDCRMDLGARDIRGEGPTGWEDEESLQ